MLTDPASASASASASAGPGPSLRDYVREGWKDLEVEYRLRKEEVRWGVRDTKGAVRRVYHQACAETGRAVQRTFQTVQRRCIQQDIQDFVQASRDWSARAVALRRQQQQQQPQQPPAHGETASATETATESNQHQDRDADIDIADTLELELEHKRQTLKHKIRAFEATLANPGFINDLNELIRTKLTSCQDLVEYYQQRPELKAYTLTKELHRMQYTLFTDQGQKLTRPQDIADYAASHSEDTHHDILWRAANQSIFGDVISTLICDDVGLIQPQFSTGSFVNDVSVTLDLGRDRPHITAECFIHVTIPSLEGEPLSLAGVLVGVYFCPEAHRMEARVLHISPAGRPLAEDELNGAAENLVNR